MCQYILQKLYVELDQERESAATAGREALSMILRLQGEKALLKMEASQYKRMAEEKMCHAQEALAVFEDISYEREMEIAALEFQLLAYQYRLLSMGVTDVGLSEVKFPENLLMNGTDTIKDEAWPHRRGQLHYCLWSQTSRGPKFIIFLYYTYI